ncbi:MAG: helix-turn-helix transcriptional regulator [Candidatus Margulisbacteria bacterium]|nr:helix-turn-helix transcriptional regulator [Candidatus Margulisiibacteriota bacterium]
MKKDWLWDRKTTLKQAQAILRNSQHPKFISLAALLLLRKNTPREIFKHYVSPHNFCENWPKIKRSMQKDAWGSPRVHFWQAIYEKVKENLSEKGIIIKAKPMYFTDAFCLEIGQKIRQIRRAAGYTQHALAKKMRISQQIISRIEKGKQNISIVTLHKIAAILNAKIEIKPQVC